MKPPPKISDLVPASSATRPAADGAALLGELENYLRRFIAYPSEDTVIAHVLWIAHTHVMDAWENTPRLAFLSPEPGSGKSRALEVTDLLVPRPIHAVNVSSAYLFRKVSDDAGTPTILFDEIDTVFGPKAKENEDLRGMLNAGTRRGATAGRCVTIGKSIETVEFPAYCAVAIAGLNDLPDTIMTRSIVVRMRRRSPGERVEPFRRRIQEHHGNELRDRLHQWLEPLKPRLQAAWPQMPDTVQDRDADCWEPLLAIAEAAGADWPELAACSAVALVADKTQRGRESLGIKLLTDCRTAFTQDPDTGKPRTPEVTDLPTETLLKILNSYTESPWGDLRGKPLDARSLARRLKKYSISPRNLRHSERIIKGYLRTDFVDAWSRYLPHPPGDLSATAATPLHPAAVLQFDISDDALAGTP